MRNLAEHIGNARESDDPRWEGRPDAPLEPLPGLCGPDNWDGTKAPKRRFILEGWIACGSAGLLSGQDGVGKSLLAQLMATCAASGREMLGISIERCNALYVTCEDDLDELQRRQEAINRGLGIDMADLKGRLLCASLKGHIGNELAILSAENGLVATPRYEQIRKKALDFGARLIFLDNAAHVFAGNENARHEVAAFLGLLERLSIEIDGAVILLAHPNKAHGQGNRQGNEFSGSTGWSAHVRNRLFLDWEGGEMPNPDGRVLRRSKANYARMGEEIAFVWHDWTFAKLDDLPPDTARQLEDIARANAENDIFLACLAEYTRQGRHVSDKPSAIYAPKIFAEMPEAKAKNIGKERLQAAMDRLFRTGKIERGIIRRDKEKGRDVEGLLEVKS